jgi:transcription elongation factor
MNLAFVEASWSWHVVLPSASVGPGSGGWEELEYVRASLSSDALQPAPYPVQRGPTAAMRGAATKVGDVSRMQAWAGQSAKRARAEAAEKIVAGLREDATALLRQSCRESPMRPAATQSGHRRTVAVAGFGGSVPWAHDLWDRSLAATGAFIARNWRTMKFSNQRLDGSEFKNCSLVNVVFDDVNLSGAKLTNVNLSGLTIENANIKGLTIFGYDVESWIRDQLRKDGCHLD